VIVLFAPVLAILGAVIACRGREARGLIAIAVAFATELAVCVATERWIWTAFCAAWLAAVLISLAFVKKAP
jgi:hypothetical protein